MEALPARVAPFFMPEIRHIKARADSLVRHEQHNGRDHLVVPVVMIVQGVLNDSLLLAEEFGKFPEAWDGRPVPIHHPERNGSPISANSPDVHERAVGTIYNTHVDGDKLKAELWIDPNKLPPELLTHMEAGKVLEVSTGYFCEEETKPGVFNGRSYQFIDRNIRPDHLALLPGQIGACSVEDGCGTPRVNEAGFFEKLVTKVAEMVAGKNPAVTHAGLVGNCNCGGSMPIDKSALATKLQAMKQQLGEAEGKKIDALVTKLNTHDKLKANEQLTPDQITLLQEIAGDAQQLKMALAFLDAANSIDAEPEPDPEPTPADMATFQRHMDAEIAKRVDEALRRNSVTERLAINSANPFSREEMASMPVAHLEKLEESIRPADYSGQTGFATNATTDEPAALGLPTGVLTKQEAVK